MNRLAKYKDPETVALVNRWFETEHGNDYVEEGKFVSIYDLFQSWSEYVVLPNMADYRMDASMFAKCLAAAKIIDIGGRWRYAENYEPTSYDMKRATA